MKFRLKLMFKVLQLSSYSTKGKLLRVLSWVLRFINNLKATVQEKSLNLEQQRNVTEMEIAETKLIRSIQSEAFEKEISFITTPSNKDKKAPLYVTQFNLLLDEDKLLRGRTRICKSSVIDSGKQPILLPSNNHYSQLLIEDCHEKVFHHGVRETLNLLRQSYWIPKGREKVKNLIRHCL